MDSMTVNKGIAAVLTAGVAYMGATILSDYLVRPHQLSETAVKIAGVETPAPAAGGADASASTAASGSPEQPLPVLLASASVPDGEAYAKKVCAACHSFTEGGKAIVGPNLYNVVGGPHAHMPGFAYSAALQGKPGTWTFAELNDWLTKPSAFAPGTKMTFAGIPDPKTRADVIDYLHTLSHQPLPLPAVASGTPAPSAAPPAAKPAGASAAPVPKGGDTGNSAAGGNGGAAPAPGQSTPTLDAAGKTGAGPASGAGASNGTSTGSSTGSAPANQGGATQ